MSWLSNALTPGSVYAARRYGQQADGLLGQAATAAGEQMPGIYSLLGGLAQNSNTPARQAGLQSLTAGAQRDFGAANAATVGAARRAGLGNSSWLANSLAGNAGQYGTTMAGARVGHLQGQEQSQMAAAQLLAGLLNPQGLAGQYQGMQSAADQQTAGLLSALAGLAGMAVGLPPMPAFPASPGMPALPGGSIGPTQTYPYVR